MAYPKTSAKAIRNAMFRLAIGTTELAQRTGLSTSRCSLLIKCDRAVTVRTIGKLSKALEVEAETILQEAAEEE